MINLLQNIKMLSFTSTRQGTVSYNIWFKSSIYCVCTCESNYYFRSSTTHSLECCIAN